MATDKQRVMFVFDDGEPHEIGVMDKGAEFTLVLKDNGTIQFEKDGRSLTIYLEDVDGN